ncbi:Kinase-like protein [Mycena venus]|uniref:Kinase-like protein n=1 Tax=Mycena venus TaxID=2733690 RepID=A0A8H7DBC7_9AGAR|nr:Kinase-like protein [Mycena venus]
MRFQFKASVVEQYSRVWAPAAVLATGLSAYTGINALVTLIAWREHPALSAMLLASMILFFFLFRVLFQLLPWLLGLCYPRDSYQDMLVGFSGVGIFNIVMLVWYLVQAWADDPWISMTICVLLNTVLLVTELALGDDFRRYKNAQIVLRCMESLVEGDSTGLDGYVPPVTSTTKPWSRMIAFLRRRPTGYIALPDDNLLEVVPRVSSAHQSHWEIPLEVNDNVLHWLRLSSDQPANKALWITLDIEDQSDDVVQDVSALLSPGEDGTGMAHVDVSETHSAFWPLVRGLAVVSSLYREYLGEQNHTGLESQLRGLEKLRSVACWGRRQNASPWAYYEDRSDIIQSLICHPLQEAHEVPNAPDVQNSGSRPPCCGTLIVHGLRNLQHAEEIYDTIHQLRDRQCQYLKIMVISDPRLLQYLSRADRHIMEYLCTLHVSATGPIRYSGRNSHLPVFYEHLFLLLVNGIHRAGGPEAEEAWKQLPGLAGISEPEAISVGDDQQSHSTVEIFSKLYNATRIRRHILQLLSGIKAVSKAISLEEIHHALVEDNTRIAEMLQLVFELNSYKKDFVLIPREHAVAVLNLTHYILDHILPANDRITDPKMFSRRAHGLLNWLAAHLKLIPEDIIISGVILSSKHPAKHGGFSDIYQGSYLDADGKQVEVALKVLKIFEDQSDERRVLLYDKFTKETLVWRYLKHKNIVPFLGVDSTTFPSPARAMVSPWMPLGSVLKYMADHSPSATYAIGWLRDVIKGLGYLHSENIVHGDLCGRNVLIDENGVARLTDFGLASFIESDTSIKSSTRGGSTRWMAPELLLPPPGSAFRRTPESDVWAFGCICCEIWSEGEVPFRHIATDMGLILALSNATDSMEHAKPYPSRPSDKGGNHMPEMLWLLAQWCWKTDPTGRPLVDAMVDTLSGMKKDPRSQSVLGKQRPRLTVISASAKGNPHDPRSRATVSSAENPEHTCPSPSPSLTVSIRKEEQQVRFEDKLYTVSFGPLEMTVGPEEVFGPIFDRLLELVGPDVLSQPILVEMFEQNHLALRFSSRMEGNNFAMTWMVHRFEPFLDVSASLVTEV